MASKPLQLWWFATPMLALSLVFLRLLVQVYHVWANHLARAGWSTGYWRQLAALGTLTTVVVAFVSLTILLTGGAIKSGTRKKRRALSSVVWLHWSLRPAIVLAVAGFIGAMIPDAHATGGPSQYRLFILSYGDIADRILPLRWVAVSGCIAGVFFSLIIRDERSTAGAGADPGDGGFQPILAVPGEEGHRVVNAAPSGAAARVLPIQMPGGAAEMILSRFLAIVVALTAARGAMLVPDLVAMLQETHRFKVWEEYARNFQYGYETSSSSPSGTGYIAGSAALISLAAVHVAAVIAILMSLWAATSALFGCRWFKSAREQCVALIAIVTTGMVTTGFIADHTVRLLRYRFSPGNSMLDRLEMRSELAELLVNPTRWLQLILLPASLLCILKLKAALHRAQAD